MKGGNSKRILIGRKIGKKLTSSDFRKMKLHILIETIDKPAPFEKHLKRFTCEQRLYFSFFAIKNYSKFSI